jgi:hypothetical protein
MTDGNLDDARRNKPAEVLRRSFLALRDKRPNRKLCIAYGIICFLLTLLVLYQSQIYIKLRSTYLKPEELTNHIKKSIEQRKEVAKECCHRNSPPPPGIIVHAIFSQAQHDLIIRAANELLNDPTVQNSFPNFDGLGVAQTDAVVVPLWKFENPYDWGQMGITEAAYVWTKDDYGNADGVTIRERPLDPERSKKLNLDSDKYPHIHGNGPPRMTKDGTPRIFLAQHLLSERTFQKLKLTLLHEFVHAHEVPGFKPWLNFVHNDLIYLPEYCEMIDKLNLDVEKRYIEYTQRFFMLLFLMLSVWYAYLASLGDLDDLDR